MNGIDNLRKRFRLFRKKFRTFRRSPRGKRFTKYATYFFQLLIVGLIIYQLSGIGWYNIYTSLPVEPLYYILFLVIYFLLPLSEVLAYRICWNIPYIKSIPTFIKKRIFNKDVMGYSGEILLMQWAVTEVELSKKQAFKDIRDMNIISSAASTFVAFGLLVILLVTGQIRALDYLFQENVMTGTNTPELFIGFGILMIIAFTAYRFRSYLFSMSFSLSLKVFLIHSVRMLLLYVAQILQWSIVLPDISMEIWFTFLSVNIIISRIPILPSQELVAAGTNIELAKMLKAPVAAISGLLLVHDVLSKSLNLFFYLYYTIRGKKGTKTIKLDKSGRS